MSKRLILTVNVTTYPAQGVDGIHTKAVMIPFSAEAVGDYFTGRTIFNGTDTQISKDSKFSLSARYLLEGTDCAGARCRLFIENVGTSLDSCAPTVITDSRELAFLETAKLSSTVECVENGVIVRIFEE
ncbi:MAG: hypothetical protein K2N38_00595 [Oscillospiraceae bacterium]|nr:hypothetical protein [Oscillospiraceae bacterium]